MATYAIGDVQGCYNDLINLLKKISFNRNQDRLLFVGDLVNRGTMSLETLRFVKQLGERAVVVLGNHDLHLLAVSQGMRSLHQKDTFGDILTARDRDELLDWLRHRPFLHKDRDSGYTLIHAGLPPQWDIATAEKFVREIEAILRASEKKDFFKHIYHDNTNNPIKWSSQLRDWELLQYAANCLTRLRFCDSHGNLTLKHTGPPGTQPKPYMPWFQVPGRRHDGHKILAGHWASLGFHSENGVITLDTGCVWGGTLTAICLETGLRYSVPCKGALKPGENE